MITVTQTQIKNHKQYETFLKSNACPKLLVLVAGIYYD